MSDPELPTVLEAILFGSGRSMSLEELSEMLGEPKGVIHVGLSNLRKRIDQREGGAIQLSDVSGRWILEVKPELSSFLPAQSPIPITASKEPKKMIRSVVESKEFIDLGLSSIYIE